MPRFLGRFNNSDYDRGVSVDANLRDGPGTTKRRHHLTQPRTRVVTLWPAGWVLPMALVCAAAMSACFTSATWAPDACTVDIWRLERRNASEEESADAEAMQCAASYRQSPFQRATAVVSIGTSVSSTSASGTAPAPLLDDVSQGGFIFQFNPNVALPATLEVLPWAERQPGTARAVAWAALELGGGEGIINPEGTIEVLKVDFEPDDSDGSLEVAANLDGLRMPQRNDSGPEPFDGELWISINSATEPLDGGFFEEGEGSCDLDNCTSCNTMLAACASAIAACSCAEACFCSCHLAAGGCGSDTADLQTCIDQGLAEAASLGTTDCSYWG